MQCKSDCNVTFKKQVLVGLVRPRDCMFGSGGVDASVNLLKSCSNFAVSGTGEGGMEGLLSREEEDDIFPFGEVEVVVEEEEE